MQHSASEHIWLSLIKISSIGDKKFDQFQISFTNRIEQWGLLACDKIHIRTTHEQKFCNLTMLCLHPDPAIQYRLLNIQKKNSQKKPKKKTKKKNNKNVPQSRTKELDQDRGRHWQPAI